MGAVGTHAFARLQACAVVKRHRKNFRELGKVGRTQCGLTNRGPPKQVFEGKIPFTNASGAGLTVPDGDYVLELRVLKALGNPEVACHRESYVSPDVHHPARDTVTARLYSGPGR